MAHQDYNMRMSKDVIWHVADKDEEHLLDELEKDSDRAAGIIAASMIESRMDGILDLVFRHDTVIRNRMLQISGPLGTFSSKIDLFFLLRIITHEAHTDLMTIKGIRNDFAHRLNLRDFTTPTIRDRVKNLALVDSHIAQFVDAGEGTQIMGLAKPVTVPFIWLQDYNNAKHEPRKRYLMACSIFVNAFMKLGLHDWLKGGLRPII